MGQAQGSQVANNMYLCSTEKNTTLEQHMTEMVNPTPQNAIYEEAGLPRDQAAFPQFEDTTSLSLPRETYLTIRDGEIVEDSESEFDDINRLSVEDEDRAPGCGCEMLPPAPGDHQASLFVPQAIYMGGYEELRRDIENERRRLYEQQRSKERTQGFLNKGHMEAGARVLEEFKIRINDQPDLNIDDNFMLQRRDPLRVRNSPIRNPNRSSIVDIEFH